MPECDVVEATTKTRACDHSLEVGRAPTSGMRSHAGRGSETGIAARRRRSRRGRRVCRRRAASRHIPTPHLREGGCRARESRESAPGRAAHAHAHRPWPAWDQCAGLSGALGVGALASGELREARCRRVGFRGRKSVRRVERGRGVERRTSAGGGATERACDRVGLVVSA